jgi:hypothetical protein
MHPSPGRTRKKLVFLITIWLFNSLPWKITMLLLGIPSISMGHIFHGYVK